MTAAFNPPADEPLTSKEAGHGGCSTTRARPSCAWTGRT